VVRAKLTNVFYVHDLFSCGNVVLIGSFFCVCSILKNHRFQFVG